jgi:uncharacterized protein (DUF302 family)
MNKLFKNRIKGFVVIAVFTVFQIAAAQNGKMMPKDGSIIKMSQYSFQETVDILKGAIEEQNLMVIYEIDAQKMLRMAGKKVPGMKQIFYFHPQYMRRVMEANQAATIRIPLKFIVMEKPNGNTVVRYFMPFQLLNSYPGEKAIAAELDQVVAAIISEITS